MHKVSTFNKISSVGLSRFTDDYTIVAEDAKDAEGLIVRSYDLHDMDFDDSLRCIARAGAGVNNIPVDECTKKGIVVFNAPGANANAVKELVIAGMLLAARNIPEALKWVNTLEMTDDVAKKIEKGKGQFAGTELRGKTLGVFGLGAIGVQVANAAEKLGMKVIGYDPYMTVNSAVKLTRKIKLVTSIEGALPECDYISLHIPAIDETKGMVNQEFLSKVKEGATLLNFARDKLIDDDALIYALKSGKLKKYITDFTTAKLFGEEGVISIPHLGASSAEAEENCATMAVVEMMDYLENGNIVNSVNFPNCSLGEKDEAARISIINSNVSGMLSKITGALGDVGINVENLINKSKGDYAYTLLEVKKDVDPEIIKSSLNFDNIVSVRVIN